tara:strand:- start:927 stop:2909 length:1983 start_codon:yes stop_codon:yes gene_type:complete
MKKFLDIAEARGDTAVFTFGRFNPPTIGHEKLLDKVASVAKSNPGAPYYIFASHSENPKKDPLPYVKKVAYMKKMFSKHSRNITTSRNRNVFELAVTLHNKGHKAIVMVVGSDRVTEFDKLLNKYNGVEGRHGYYGFDNIEVVSAGERDPDAEGVSGMSASKMRAAASSDDYDTFKLGLPKNFNAGMSLFKDVRKFMGIRESFIEHQVNMTEEDVIRDMYIENKIFCTGDIVEDDYSGVSGAVVRRGTNYLVFAENDGTTHKRWLYEVRKVKQDKDVEDMKGTQPAKYYAKDADGDKMSKSTKDARAKHFAKGDSRKPAPGDADADTKPSKYTKKFKQMYGEEDVKEENLKKVYQRAYNNIVKDYTDMVKQGKGKHSNSFYLSRAAMNYGFDSIKPIKDYVNSLVKSNELPKELSAENEKTNEEIDMVKTFQQFQLDEKIEGLVNKSDQTGVPYSILKKSYDRGMAAWKGGHRPGASQQQWAFARVNSMLTGGKADPDLQKQIRAGGYKKKKKSKKEDFQEEDPCWDTHKQVGMKKKNGKMVPNCVPKEEKVISFKEHVSKSLYDHAIMESEYQGRKVKLNDPFRLPSGSKKKFGVYVKNDKGNIVKVTFGDPNMGINRDDPDARKSFRARHQCDTNPGPKWKARYWSCYQWRAGSKVDN